MLSVYMLSVVMLSVVAPFQYGIKNIIISKRPYMHKLQKCQCCQGCLIVKETKDGKNYNDFFPSTHFPQVSDLP